MGELMGLVSEPLRVELHFEMFAEPLHSHSFFARYIEECPHVMRKVCHSCMTMTTVSVGDILFNAGEIASKPKMLLINHGILTYVFGSSANPQKTGLEKGHWVCEASLWVPWVHRGMLTATKDSSMYELNGVEFQSIVSSFEHSAGFDPMKYAIRFLDELNSLPKEEVSDLPLPEQLVEREQEMERLHSSKSQALMTRMKTGSTRKPSCVESHTLESTTPTMCSCGTPFTSGGDVCSKCGAKPRRISRRISRGTNGSAEDALERYGRKLADERSAVKADSETEKSTVIPNSIPQESLQLSEPVCGPQSADPVTHGSLAASYRNELVMENEKPSFVINPQSHQTIVSQMKGSPWIKEGMPTQYLRGAGMGAAMSPPCNVDVPLASVKVWRRRIIDDEEF